MSTHHQLQHHSRTWRNNIQFEALVFVHQVLISPTLDRVIAFATIPTKKNSIKIILTAIFGYQIPGKYHDPVLLLYNPPMKMIFVAADRVWRPCHYRFVPSFLKNVYMNIFAICYI